MFYLLCYWFQDNEGRVAKEVNMYLWVVITPFFVMRILLIVVYLSKLYIRQLPVLTLVYCTNFILQMTWLMYALVTLPGLLPAKFSIAFFNYISLIVIHAASIFLIIPTSVYFLRREWKRAATQVSAMEER